jgi:hypothetical protein
VAVAGDTEVAEVDEVGLSSVRVEPIGDRFVYRTRVTEVVCAGQDKTGLPRNLLKSTTRNWLPATLRRSSSSRAGIGLSAAV